MNESLHISNMAKIARSARISSRWCFTLNNPTEEEIEAMQSRKAKFVFLRSGLEHAPTSGTPHIQGYCELQTRTRQSTMEKRKSFLSAAWSPGQLVSLDHITSDLDPYLDL
jgi:hypothetical protein